MRIKLQLLKAESMSKKPIISEEIIKKIKLSNQNDKKKKSQLPVKKISINTIIAITLIAQIQ